MPDRPWKDEFTLLCEKCGYVIEGLDPGGACPECGKAIAESLPERRVGTAWQQRHGLLALFQTWAQCVRSPDGVVSILRSIPERNSVRLMSITIAMASLVASAGYFMPSQIHRFQPFGARQIETFAMILAISLVPFTLLLLLTWIEGRGLRLIARSREFRLGPNFAIAVVAHGCVGWIFSALGFVIGNFAAIALIRAMTPELESTGDEMLDTFAQIMSSPPRWVYYAGWAFMILGAIPGFLFFEVFAWLGLRRCKFANRVRPTEPEALERP